MSIRFNRNNSNVPNDRLFPADFITDQNGQDADILQLAKDFGCLPCCGEGLELSTKSQADHKVEVSAGWCYDKDGHRITIESPQELTLSDTSGGNNYIILTHTYTTSANRNAHRTGVSYPTRKTDSFQLTLQSTAPGLTDICLGNCKQNGSGTITIDFAERCARSCKLISQDKLAGVEQETSSQGSGPPSGQKPDLPDLPKGRKIPMPIILGLETVMPEELGRTAAAVSAFNLQRVYLHTGTPIADVKIWIGDWGNGQRDGSNSKKCNFQMDTMKSGVTTWDDDLWITNPPGYYYLVKADESWFSRITDSGSDWVVCEDEIPAGGLSEYYLCPYADKYRVEVTPYQTDAVLSLSNARHIIEAPTPMSPAKPVLTVKGLNLGGKYRIKVASMISNEKFTKWAEDDFIVGLDLLLCWKPAASYLTANPVDGGVEVLIPGTQTGYTLPEGYEICYTYGLEDVPEPDFDNVDHSTIHVKDHRFKLDVPPGHKVRIRARAISRRMIMRCSGQVEDVVLDVPGGYVVAGGVSLRRNRKNFTGIINEANVPASGTQLADHVPLPNAVWPEKIFLFNNTASTQSNFEVYVHGANQAYTDGRKIKIGTGGDYPSLASKGAGEVSIADFKITDAGMKITVKNTDTGPQTINLNYGIQYREDSD